MSLTLPKLVARPLVQLWLKTSPASWRRQVIAADSPHVHGAGTNPDRVLLAGDGVATGRGVLTHDLGLPGHLARSLSFRTGHATDVDARVHEGTTVHNCFATIAGIDLFRYDVIVLSVGHNEALTLMNVREWRSAIHTLLERVADAAPASTKIFLLMIPVFGPRTQLPAALADVVDGHAEALNRATAELAATMPTVTLIPVENAAEFEAGAGTGAVHLYRRWADGIAAHISDELDPERIPAGQTATTDEEGRLRALEYLDTVDTHADPVLEGLTTFARRTFETPIAAITLVRSDTQTMVAVSGMEPTVLPRSQAICDVTIRRATHLVIEDAAMDSRFAHYSVVAGELGVRFYAGYPIESPDGHRVGALCVMDTEPRQFTARDIALLRTLAHSVQDHLYRGVGW